MSRPEQAGFRPNKPCAEDINTPWIIVGQSALVAGVLPGRSDGPTKWEADGRPINRQRF